jgi:hypothetical protein
MGTARSAAMGAVKANGQERTTEVSAMMGDERSQEEVIEEFAHYVSPSRVATYRQMGFEMVAGRREGSRIRDWDGKRSFEDRALVSRRSR